MRRIITVGKKKNARSSKKGSSAAFTALVWTLSLIVPITVLMLIWYSKPFSDESMGEIEESIVENVENTVPVKNNPVNILVCGTDESGMLTDVILIVRIDPDNDKINILQIPRDTYVGVGSTGKINSAYAQGDKDLTPVNRLVKIINEQFRLPVSHYGIISLEAFRNIVDTIGGVPVTLPKEIVFEPDKILPQGYQILSGTQAEWFVRHRSSYATGDIGRLGAQRIFMSAFVKKAKTLTVGQLISLIPEASENVMTDLSVAQMAEYASRVYDIDTANISLYMLPGEGTMHNGQSVWSIHKEPAASLLNAHFRDEGKAVDASQLPVTELANTMDYFDNTEEKIE